MTTMPLDIELRSWLERLATTLEALDLRVRSSVPTPLSTSAIYVLHLSISPGSKSTTPIGDVQCRNPNGLTEYCQ